MTTVGDIVIAVGADIGPLVREFDRAKGKISEIEKSANKMGLGLKVAMGVAGTAAGAAAVAVIGMTRASLQNIDVVSKQARALGLSVSSFQAMAMVAGEAGVETEQLSKVLVKMQDNIVSLGQGTKAQVEQFARLGVSMADLRGLGADEQFKVIAERLNGITDPAERTAAALNVFGKSGVDVITMLEGYGAAVDQAAQFQEKLGIAVSDVDAEKIEMANDAMGRLGMVAEGMGNKMAVIVAPALDAFANALMRITGIAPEAQLSLETFFGSIQAARESLGDGVVEKLIGNPEKIRESAAALEEISQISFAVDEIDAAYSAMIAFVETLRFLGKEVEAHKLEGLADDLDKASIAFADGTITGEEFKAKITQIGTSAVLLLTNLQGVDTATFGNVIARIGDLSRAIATAAKNAAALVATVGGAISGDDRGEAIAESRSGLGGLFTEGVLTPDTVRPRAAPSNVDFGVADSGGGGGGGGSGGGGGLADKFAARLATIVTSLKTEKEVIDAWYAESLTTIQTATDAELAVLGGKHEALERLEEEHQERLLAIKDMGNKWSLDSALGGAADIFGALGAFNKKALKMQSIASAGQALISTWEGAAKELRKGTFGFASAAAVVAKGLGFVAAIKSAGSGGGGGGGAGAGASSGGGAAAAPQQAVQTMNFHVSNDPFGFGERMIRQLATQMNEASRNGMNIRASVVS